MPEWLMMILDFIREQDWLMWVGAITMLLNAAIAVFALIPGEQPEKFLQKIVDFISGFSRKKIK
jgi:hypothetical protein